MATKFDVHEGFFHHPRGGEEPRGGHARCSNGALAVSLRRGTSPVMVEIRSRRFASRMPSSVGGRLIRRSFIRGSAFRRPL